MKAIQSSFRRSISSQFTEQIGWWLTMSKKAGLQVALDGSHDAGFASYAGVAGTQAAWMALDEKWESLLTEHGIDYLRMSEAMNWRGEFEKKKTEWGTERIAKRDECLRAFAEAARQFGFMAAGFAVEAGGQDPSLNTHEARKRDLFQRVILDLLKHGPPDCFYVIACDQEEDMVENARKWLAKLRLSQQDGGRIMGLCFVDDKAITQIQLADMVAYVVREDLARQTHRPTESPSDLYRLLAGRSKIASGLILNGQIVSENA